MDEAVLVEEIRKIHVEFEALLTLPRSSCWK
jgi:hypothetical protein